MARPITPVLITRPESTTHGQASRRSGSDELGELELLATWMDSAFQIPGTKIRFGLDALLGLVPGLGDVLTSLISLHIVRSAQRAGVSRATLARMTANIGIDLATGMVPVAGDAFDIYWKANQKNLQILRRHVSDPSSRRKAAASDAVFFAILVVIVAAILIACAAVAFAMFSWLRAQFSGG